MIGVYIQDYGLETTSNGMLFRDVSITDNSKEMMIVTIWGMSAEKFEGKHNSVMVFRKAMLGEFHGQKIKLLFWNTDFSKKLFL